MWVRGYIIDSLAGRLRLVGKLLRTRTAAKIKTRCRKREHLSRDYGEDGSDRKHVQYVLTVTVLVVNVL